MPKSLADAHTQSLWIAIRDRDIEGMRQALEAGADVNRSIELSLPDANFGFSARFPAVYLITSRFHEGLELLAPHLKPPIAGGGTDAYFSNGWLMGWQTLNTEFDTRSLEIMLRHAPPTKVEASETLKAGVSQADAIAWCELLAPHAVGHDGKLSAKLTLELLDGLSARQSTCGINKPLMARQALENLLEKGLLADLSTVSCAKRTETERQMLYFVDQFSGYGMQRSSNHEPDTLRLLIRLGLKDEHFRLASKTSSHTQWEQYGPWLERLTAMRAQMQEEWLDSHVPSVSSPARAPRL